MSDRESMEFDVVVVGAGPAGLAAAIRLKQCAPERGLVEGFDDHDSGKQPFVLAHALLDCRHRGSGDISYADLHRGNAVASDNRVREVLWICRQAFDARPAIDAEAADAAVLRHVEGNLATAALNTDSLAAHLQISRRTVQSMFEAHGGFATYLRRRRLAAVVRLLDLISHARGAIRDGADPCTWKPFHSNCWL